LRLYRERDDAKKCHSMQKKEAKHANIISKYFPALAYLVFCLNPVMDHGFT
jgi:hypothetical protein